MSRADFLALAQSFVGCSYDGDPDRFCDLVAPGEIAAVADAMAHESTCGLFVRGLLAASGVTDARMVAPYRSGHVMSDIYAMAREAKALQSLGVVEPGDIVMLSSPEHVFVVEEISDVNVISSIQGGERDDAGAQIIERIPRTVTGAGAGLRVGGRPVELCVDVEKLLLRFAPPCSICNGSGVQASEDPNTIGAAICYNCNGSGTIF